MIEADRGAIGRAAGLMSRLLFAPFMKYMIEDLVMHGVNRSE